MAQAGHASSTDRNIIAASAAYRAAYAEFGRLCEHYADMPDELARTFFERRDAEKKRVVKRSAVSIAGVVAKARMVEAGELDDIHPLIASTIRDLLAVAGCAASQQIPDRQCGFTQ